MGEVWFRFYAELNDFLPEEHRYIRFAHRCALPASVKELIESLGVISTEVDLVLVNDESVDFSYVVRDGDRISVYPVFESFDIAPIQRVRSKPLRETRFVLDSDLGVLAHYLRILGLDARVCERQELVTIACDEGRIALTRDPDRIASNDLTHGYCVREEGPRNQLAEVIQRFDLAEQLGPNWWERIMQSDEQDH